MDHGRLPSGLDYERTGDRMKEPISMINDGVYPGMADEKDYSVEEVGR